MRPFAGQEKDFKMNPEIAKKYLEQIEQYGQRRQGRKELIKHLKGERITRGEACLAQCYWCMGYYMDGPTDCRMEYCPNYQYFPYKKGIENEANHSPNKR